jgi:hypothetical protein
MHLPVQLQQWSLSSMVAQNTFMEDQDSCGKWKEGNALSARVSVHDWMMHCQTESGCCTGPHSHVESCCMPWTQHPAPLCGAPWQDHLFRSPSPARFVSGISWWTWGGAAAEVQHEGQALTAAVLTSSSPVGCNQPPSQAAYLLELWC